MTVGQLLQQRQGLSGLVDLPLFARQQPRTDMGIARPFSHLCLVGLVIVVLLVVNSGNATEIERVSSLTPQQFLCRFALAGRPFILEGGASKWPAMHRWTLAWFQEQFGDAVRNRQIRPGEAVFDEDGSNQGVYEPASAELPLQTATGEHYISWLVTDEAIAAVLRSDYEIPAFLEGLQRHGEYVSEGQGKEYLFIGQASAQGREPHVDYSCNNVWSAQLQGRKIWRFLPPNATSGVLFPEAHDVPRSSLQQEDQLVGTLLPGDIVVWYPGWTHATETLDDTSVALSVEFAVPPPIDMLRQNRAVFLEHGRRYGSFSPCEQQWGNRFATLSGLGFTPCSNPPSIPAHNADEL